MIILGLGTNIGDRLAHLRKALCLIRQIDRLTVEAVSPVYQSDALLPDNAPISWDQPYLNAAIRCHTNLTPIETLSLLKSIEKKMQREVDSLRWSPRIIDIDLLAWGDALITQPQLKTPHPGLLTRPFALWPLADVAPLWVYPEAIGKGKTAAQLVENWGSRFSGDAPFHTQQIHQRIDTPQLVGILNITPDSFSDGGRFINQDQAIEHVKHLVKAGADVIDIGAESTSPTASPISPNEEWDRLEPLFNFLSHTNLKLPLKPKLSLDTRHVAVAEKAICHGVDWINDVSGLDDIKMRALIAEAPVRCVVMHHLTIPERRQISLPRNKDPYHTVIEWAKNRFKLLESSGIDAAKLIFDPGIGFGKTAEQSLVLMRNAAGFAQLGAPILIGHSRKTFMSNWTEQPFNQRDLETVALSIKLIAAKIDYLRVHHVSAHARAFKLWMALS